MIDHVTIRVSDLAGSRRFYGHALDLLELAPEPVEGQGFVEWNDFSISEARPDRPLTRRLHIGFTARSREEVVAWWRALTAAGYRDDGAPGPRPQYRPDYYGAFVLDPDGNSVEAAHHESVRENGIVDHLWLRVQSVDATRRFWETVAPAVGYDVRLLPDRVRVHGDGGSFSALEGEPTENVHIAFAVPDRGAVEEFHRVAVAAGYRDNGAPGERPEYHAGYYGAFVLDPDGHNIEAVFHDR